LPGFEYNDAGGSGYGNGLSNNAGGFDQGNGGFMSPGADAQSSQQTPSADNKKVRGFVSVCCV
jgi:hypothetical protein